MYEVGPPDGTVRLCLNCYVMLTNAMTARAEIIQRDIERAQNMIDLIVGRPPRHQPSPQHFHTGTVNVSNLHIRDSNIGVLNTGNLTMLGSCISVLAEQGEQTLTTAISELTRAVIQASSISTEQKNEIIEVISGIASEAVQPQERRRKHVIKSLVQTLAMNIGTVSALITVWDKVRPYFEALIR